MKEKDNGSHTASSIIGDIFGGNILEREFITKNWKFILYCSFLVIFYISYNFAYNAELIENRKTEQEIKNLNADYSSKYAKLLYKSKRNEIEIMLQKKGSEIKAPKDPAKRIKLE